MNAAVHGRLRALFPSLFVDDWRYRGFKVDVSDRRLRYRLRFEKLIVEKLAYAEVDVTDEAIRDHGNDLAGYLTTKLGECERGMLAARQHELN